MRSFLVSLLMFIPSALFAQQINPQQIEGTAVVQTPTVDSQTGGRALNNRFLNNTYYLAESCTSSPSQTCLTNALTAIGAASASLVVNISLPITSTVTIPTNVSLQIVGSGAFNVSSGQSLIIAGSFDALLKKVFYGAGSVYFYGGSSTVKVLPQWFGATGNGKAAGFASTAGNPLITLALPLATVNFVVGDAVTLVGAGPGGANLIATVTSTVTGNSFNVSPAPSTTVMRAPIYTEDDSAALNAWTASVRGSDHLANFYDNRAEYGPSLLYLPKGNYPVCSTPVLVFASTVMQAEQSSTNVGGAFAQCNPAINVLKISANGYTPDGMLINYGNGNSYFDHIQIRGSYDPGAVTVPPVIQYLNAGNVHSDNRWDHLMLEGIAGSGFGFGFITSTAGTATAGTTTVTLADGSTFCTAKFAAALNQPCNQIIIVGAGTAMTNLTANIISGVPDPPTPRPSGQSYTVTIDTPIVTTVSNAPVYAGHDFNGSLTIEHAEMDSGRWFLLSQGNASGSVVISDAEIFAASNGALRSVSLNPVDLEFTHSSCMGCGFTGGDAATGPAIYWGYGSTGQLANVRIESNSFSHLFLAGTELGGPVWVSNARNVLISKNTLYNPDMVHNVKGITVSNARDVDITDNHLYWDATYTAVWGNSQAIETIDTIQTPSVHLSGNTITNNSSATLYCGICSGDADTTGYSVIGNNFLGSGAIRTQINSNIISQQMRNTLISQDHVVKWGTTRPTSGTWKVGDIIYNNAPASGQPMGWVCTASGTPGAWTALSNIP